MRLNKTVGFGWSKGLSVVINKYIAQRQGQATPWGQTIYITIYQNVFFINIYLLCCKFLPYNTFNRFPYIETDTTKFAPAVK